MVSKKVFKQQNLQRRMHFKAMAGKHMSRMAACVSLLCVTDLFKAILLWWFFLFYVLVFKIFVLLAPFVCFHILVKETECPLIGKITAHSAYDMFSW